MLIPSRQRGFEHLDNPALAPAIAAQSLADIALANRLFGGTRAVLQELTPIVREFRAQHRAEMSLLDVGTGLADIPTAAVRLAQNLGVSIRTVGLEKTQTLTALGRGRINSSVAGDALALPFADQSIDVIVCSLLLHHFDDGDAATVLAECARVARRCVIVSDLRRSWIAIALIWLVSFPLRFHPISRHDGMTSVRRGYTQRELFSLVRRAVHVDPVVARKLGWRVTATWNPRAVPS